MLEGETTVRRGRKSFGGLEQISNRVRALEPSDLIVAEEPVFEGAAG